MQRSVRWREEYGELWLIVPGSSENNDMWILLMEPSRHRACYKTYSALDVGDGLFMPTQLRQTKEAKH
jgi:hypothetical protein